VWIVLLFMVPPASSLADLVRPVNGSYAGSIGLARLADESAVSLIPPVHRTWSPRGRTPILRHRFGQPSYDTDSLIGVLEQLAGFYAGHRVVLVWDGLSAHWSTRCGPGWTASTTG
jgi:hypothetical protein